MQNFFKGKPDKVRVAPNNEELDNPYAEQAVGGAGETYDVESEGNQHTKQPSKDSQVFEK